MVRTYSTKYGKFSIICNSGIFEDLQSSALEPEFPLSINGELTLNGETFLEQFNEGKNAVFSIMKPEYFPEDKDVFDELQTISDNVYIEDFPYSTEWTRETVEIGTNGGGLVSALNVEYKLTESGKGYNTNIQQLIFNEIKAEYPIQLLGQSEWDEVSEKYVQFQCSTVVQKDDFSEAFTLILTSRIQNAGGVDRIISQFSISTISTADVAKIKDFYDGTEDYGIGTDNPYGEPPSEPGGGSGEGKQPSDSIDFPTEPDIDIVESGFITIYKPTLAELQNLQSFLWSHSFTDNIVKIFGDAINAVLGIQIVPVSIPGGGTKEIKLGNIQTGVNSTVAQKQFVTIDCGTIQIPPQWKQYLDFEPFTKTEIFFPFIGQREINTNDLFEKVGNTIVGKSLQIKYIIDILSGQCTASLKCGSSVLYEFMGACSAEIPITGQTFPGVIAGALGQAGNVGSLIQTGGTSAFHSVPGLVNSAQNLFNAQIQKTGGMNGSGGRLAIKKPYLIMTKPVPAVPKNQQDYMGYPSFIEANLSNIKGYTEIEYIHIENIKQTDNELNEIERLLKEGVIL